MFHGILTYKAPKYCPICGCINEHDNDIIKWSFKRNCKIKLPKTCCYNTILLLDKQRFKCKQCKHTFTASTNIVDFHNQISNQSRVSITLDLMNKGSEKDIAKRNNVSSSTVNRVLNEISKDKIIKNNGKLPSVFGIDEFKATNDTISKMAFIIVNQKTRNIFDIKNSRKSIDIEKYFKHYTPSERKRLNL